MTIKFLTTGLAAALLVFPAVAQDRESVWTRVTAEGRTITLTWDKQHPWSEALSARGADLVAKYLGPGNREMAELVGRAAGRGKERALQFSLPDMVRYQPGGSVCLFVQLPDRRPLPVRRATAQNGDTAGFQYEAWGRQLRRQAEVGVARERVAAAERELAASARNLASQEKVIADNGWGKLRSCEDVPMPAPESAIRPYQVVDLADQDEIAHRICIYRAWNSREVSERYITKIGTNLSTPVTGDKLEKAQEAFAGVYEIAFMLPDVARRLLTEWKLSNQPRERQAEQFLKDWARLSPAMKGYTPHLGRANDTLDWPSAALPVALRVLGPELAKRLKAEWIVANFDAPTDEDRLGLAGAALDSYYGCLEDSARQLRREHENWQRQQASAGRRAASTRDFFVRECRTSLDELAKVKKEHAVLEEQLKREQQALAAGQVMTPLPNKPQVLNFSVCR